jgi:putative chitinase
MITNETFDLFAPNAPLTYAKLFEKERQSSSVTTPLRLAHFLAQIHHESLGLTRLVESFYYRPERLTLLFSSIPNIQYATALLKGGAKAVANRIYANRLGNGSEASGDGWKYRGSGFIQLTGRDNFRLFGNLINLPLEEDPDLARQPEIAVRIAYAYWDYKKLSPLADLDNVREITRLINGNALLGLRERAALVEQAKKIWK